MYIMTLLLEGGNVDTFSEGGIMNVLSERILLFFGGNTQLCFWKISLRGISRELVKINFWAVLWKYLLALSGPTHTVLLVKDSVKDNIVDNWG